MTKIENSSFRAPPELGAFWVTRPMNWIRFKTILANKRSKP